MTADASRGLNGVINPVFTTLSPLNAVVGTEVVR